MGKLTTSIGVPQPPDSFANLEEVQEYLRDIAITIHDQLTDIYNEFNGRIEVINLFAVEVTVANTGTADTDFAVAHNLGTTEIFYIPKINGTTLAASTTFYRGTTPWTTNIAYLRSKVASLNVTFLVIG